MKSTSDVTNDTQPTRRQHNFAFRFIDNLINSLIPVQPLHIIHLMSVGNYFNFTIDIRFKKNNGRDIRFSTK